MYVYIISNMLCWHEIDRKNFGEKFPLVCSKRERFMINLPCSIVT